MVGRSYRAHDNKVPGRAMLTPPSRELAERVSKPPGQNLSASSDWNQAHTRLQTVFGKDQTHVDNVRELVKTSSRVHAVLTGDTTQRGDETQRSAIVMRGYTGHVPGAREVVATGYRGYIGGNAYRGPQHAPAPYYAPAPPNKCSEGP